ncbi:MAG: hypothetical protein KDB80_09995 [Planctomycetes bacterium]|nr:hypothetical protein [Planctomycetota bacterium]
MASFYKEFPKTSAFPTAAVSLVMGGLATVMALSLIASFGVIETTEGLGRAFDEHVVPTLSSGKFWTSLPSLPSNWSVFLDPIPGGTILGLFLLSAVVMRWRMKRSWASVGIVVLMLSSLPIVFGTLCATKLIPIDVSKWLGTMLTTFALGAATCAACALLHLLNPKKPPRHRKGAVRSFDRVVPAERRTG